MESSITSLESLRIRLNKQGLDFICDTPLPATTVVVTFLGPFAGETIVWKMTLAVLKAGDKPFIEIQQGSNGVYPVSVGLVLPLIDEAVIKKSIIMMRNYKRLTIGRIEFGSMHT